ncbi:MAG TPA: ABC transporter permease [Gemmatimonadales bacterium]|nr:ABC transporter permease [Gemmatimonadales bacterium]
MTTWLVRRVAASIAIVFAVVTFTFLLLHLAPGQPFLPGDETPIDPRVVANLRHEFGLDQPVLVQYVKYLGALAHGNLGESFALHRPVADALADAIPNTLVLAGAALVLDLLLGLALGVYQAVHAHRLPDIGLGYATLFVGSLPTFWLALFLLLVFGEWLGWFPVGGVVDPVVHASLPWVGRVADRLWHLALPALTLGCVGAAGTARYQRAAMLDAMGHDYVRTARAKGLPEGRVVLVHTLRNALLPLITLLGLSLPFLLTGAVLVETVYAWPGMGKLAADAVFKRDYPVVLATAVTASTMVVLGSLVADVLYAVADPRIRVRA